MSEESFVITNREQLNKCLSRIDRLLLKIINPLDLKLSVSKEMFDQAINEIVPRLRFSDIGIISRLNVINNDYIVFEEDNFSFNQILKEKCIIKFPIPKDMTLQIYSQVIILNEVSGTIFLMDDNASLFCDRLNHAKVITQKNAQSDLTSDRVYIKGDQLI